MPYYSTAPAFKNALHDALGARSGLSGVTVSYGAPTGAPREFIALTDISGSQEFAALGAACRKVADALQESAPAS